MSNLNIKENNHFNLLKENIKTEEINGFGNIFINCCNIYPKKKLYNLYLQYIVKNINQAIEISNNNNNNQFIVHINLKNVKLKNFSYSFVKFLNNELSSNPLFVDKLKTANFYYKDIITKNFFDFIYNIIDKDTRPKFNLIFIEK